MSSQVTQNKKDWGDLEKGTENPSREFYTNNAGDEIKISIDISALKKCIENTIIQSLEFYFKYNKDLIQTMAVIPDNKILLTTKEACIILRCTRTTIHRYKTQLSLPFIKRGKAVLFYRTDLEALLIRNSIKARNRY